MQERKIKFHGLSWVIELHFADVTEAKRFAEREGMILKLINVKKSAIIRIED